MHLEGHKMLYMLIALLLLLVIGIAFGLVKKTKLQADDAFAYQKNRTFLTPAEQSLLDALEKSLGRDYRVFGKIRLADAVKVKDGLSRAAGRRVFNAISTRYVDFLICRANDMSIKGAVAMDDQAHHAPQGVPRDLFVDKVLEATQIPQLRVKARTSYSVSEIKDRLERCGIIKVESIQGLPVKEKKGGEKVKESIRAKIEPVENTPSIELKVEAVCPRCGSGMVEKVATKGKYAGRKYLGCSNFPHCRYIEGIIGHG